ncbi:MAG: CsbD family protein [Methylomonas sp.]|nr:MAG: CsbD family protein [Methylomonas sp.]
MKLSNHKLIILSVSVISLLCSVGAYALDAPVNKDQVEGRAEEAKGKIKETTGNIIEDKEMETEGKNQKNLGKVQKGYGDIKQDIKDGK